MSDSAPLNLLIIGAGMYVCGRGTSGFGTILPALGELQRHGYPLGTVNLAATNPQSIVLADAQLKRLNKAMGTRLAFGRTYPDRSSGADPESYRRALAEMPSPAAAIVVVPDHLHHQVVADCLSSGLHTLVVKPLTPTVSAARELIRLRQQHGVYGAVEFHKRYDRANLKIKEILQTGQIGRPLYFLVEYSQRKSIPARTFAGWVDQTNIFQYLGVHYVDIIHFLTGARPVRAMARGQWGWLKEKGVEVYDAVHGTIDWLTHGGDHFVSYILTNWVDPESTSAMSDQRIKVIGTRGRCESDQKKRGLQLVSDENGIEDINPDFCATYLDEKARLTYKGYGIKSIHTFIKDVNAVVQGKVRPEDLESMRPSFESALAATAVVEAVNASLKNGGAWIDIAY